MRALYDFSQADPAAFDIFQWFNIVGAVGCIFWIAAYILIVRKCFHDKAYGLPLVAIAMNVAWELHASFVFPNPVPLWHVFDRAWLAIDVILIYQLLRYGRDLQTHPFARRNFVVIVIVAIGLSLWGEYAFVADYRDRLGLVVAFMVNLVMSIAFIFFFFARAESGRGLSLGAGICKMLGTLGTSIECQFVVRMIDPQPSYLFLTFLNVTIFAFDLMYVVLLWRWKRARASR